MIVLGNSFTGGGWEQNTLGLMTDHLGKQGGRGAGIWALKQQLFALVCCCVPLVLF